jgi:magnesium-transporting ATPase (P-type)
MIPLIEMSSRTTRSGSLPVVSLVSLARSTNTRATTSAAVLIFHSGSAIYRHWLDLGVIMALLILNAVVGFWQEHQAANAVDALKKQLALKARVKRDGKWTDIGADRLVLGDIIRLRLVL